MKKKKKSKDLFPNSWTHLTSQLNSLVQAMPVYHFRKYWLEIISKLYSRFIFPRGGKRKYFEGATAFVFVLSGVVERFIKLFYPPLRFSLRVYSLPRLTSRLFDPSFFASAPANRIRFPPPLLPFSFVPDPFVYSSFRNNTGYR